MQQGGFLTKRFHRTSKLTVDPAVTFSPAAGACDTIMLAGDGCTGALGVTAWPAPL